MVEDIHCPSFVGNFGKNANNDTRIKGYDPVISPALLQSELPIPYAIANFVKRQREEIEKIVQLEDDRLLVIVGPCSLHDPIAAFEYAKELKSKIPKYEKELSIVMRCYMEKPRSGIGWKGLINDPDLDGTFKINKGLWAARRLYIDILSEGIGIASEMLDCISPQYLDDLICWSAIGARTTESQLHRELASGLSFCVGFKNGTDGNIGIAIDAMKSSSQPHHFLSITKQGVAAIVSTMGNNSTHIILRGGKDVPNYDEKSIENAVNMLISAQLPESLMVDCSHGNSQKNHKLQIVAARSLANQIAAGQKAITGVMIESNLHEDKQQHLKPHEIHNLKYGVSITDSCVNLEDTWKILDELASAVKQRRAMLNP